MGIILTALLILPAILHHFMADNPLFPLALFSEVILYLGLLGSVLPFIGDRVLCYLPRVQWTVPRGMSAKPILGSTLTVPLRIQRNILPSSQLPVTLLILAYLLKAAIHPIGSAG